MDLETIKAVQDPLIGTLERLAVELAVLIVIIPVIYRRFANNKEHLFPFFLMGIMIFLVCVFQFFASEPITSQQRTCHISLL